jgi:type IV fimbrial biogenesis protein FimT
MKALAATLRNVRTARPNRLARGLTLIECCVVASVAAVLAGTAVPSFDSFQKRRTLEGVAAEALTDLHYARSEAVSRNRTVRVSYLSAPDGASCMIIHTGKAADCQCGNQGTAVCSASTTVLKAKAFAAGSPVTLTSNVDHMIIEPVRAMFTLGGKVQAKLADGSEVRHVVAPHGRIKTCSPEGKMKGFPVC